MEAIFASQTLDRDWRHAKTLKRIPNHANGHRSFDLRMVNGAVLGGGGTGLLFPPAWTDPYSILYSNAVGDLSYHVQPPLRPLLPSPSLPSKPYNNNIKALSYPPPNNSKSAGKPNKSSSSSSLTSSAPSPLTPKKSSPKSKPHLKKDQNINSSKPAATPRPDPAKLPRDVFVSTKGNPTSSKQQPAGYSDVEFSGPSIYIMAPPPSSLPLPSFVLRPKLSCNAEAAASVVSTNSLRQIQRLP